MDLNFAQTLNELLGSIAHPANNPPNDEDMSDLPPLEPIAPTRDNTTIAASDVDVDMQAAPADTVDDDDNDMPELQSVSDSSSEADSDSDQDANEVEMQTVDDDNDSSWTDDEENMPGLQPVDAPRSSAPRNANRRARVEDDEDDERDRRHPSQRTNSANDDTPPNPFQPPPAQRTARPEGHGDHAHFFRNLMQNTRPATANGEPGNAIPLFGGIAITIDLHGHHHHGPHPAPVPNPNSNANETDANANPAPPPLPFPFTTPHHQHTPNANPQAAHEFITFAEIMNRLGFLGTAFGLAPEPEVEDPERAKRLVDGLEEVPVGLVRRLETVGGGAVGGEDEGGGSGGDSGCAICWDRLLDPDGGGFGEESSSAPATDAETAPAPHPKIVSLPCAHVFHAACLIPWFSRPRQTTCPTCRFNIDPENLTYVRRRREPPAAAAATAGAPQPPQAESVVNDTTTAAPSETAPTDLAPPSPPVAPTANPDPDPNVTPTEGTRGFMTIGFDMIFAPAIGMEEMDGMGMPMEEEGDEGMGVAMSEEEVVAWEQMMMGGGMPPPQAQQPDGGDEDIPPLEPVAFGGASITADEDGGVDDLPPLVDVPNVPHNAEANAGNPPNAGANGARGWPPMAFPLPAGGMWMGDMGGVRAGGGQWRTMGDIMAQIFRIGAGGGHQPQPQQPQPNADAGVTPQSAGVQPPQPQPQGGANHRGLPPGFAQMFPWLVGGRGGQAVQPVGADATAPSAAPASSSTTAPQSAEPQPQPATANTRPMGIPHFMQFGVPTGGNATPGNNAAVNGFSVQFGQRFHTLFPGAAPLPIRTPTAADDQPNPAPNPIPPPPPPGVIPGRIVPHFHIGGLPRGAFAPPQPRAPREKKAWTLPVAPGPTLRQRVERKEREAGLRCIDVSCGVGPSDEEPFVKPSEAAKKQIGIQQNGERVCLHTFHAPCLVSAERVAMRGLDRSVDGEEVEVSCSVCRAVGCVSKTEWEEGVQALA